MYSKCHVEEVSLKFENELPPTYPPQRHHTQTVSRTVEVEWGNWKYSQYRIIEGATQMYTAKTKLRKPQMVSENSETSESLSTVVFHSHTSRIDIRLRGKSIVLASNGLGMNKWTYGSPALHTTLTWKRKSMASKMFDFVRLDRKVPIAQFTVNNTGVTKIGKIKFFGDRAKSGTKMDEIVTMGLALANFWLLQMMVPGLALVSSIASV